jgi:hypothetical protein
MIPFLAAQRNEKKEDFMLLPWLNIRKSNGVCKSLVPFIRCSALPDIAHV